MAEFDRVISWAQRAKDADKKKQIKELQDKIKKTKDATQKAKLQAELDDLMQEDMALFNQEYTEDEKNAALQAMQDVTNKNYKQALSDLKSQDKLGTSGDVENFVKQAAISLKSKHPGDNNMFYYKNGVLQVSNKYKNEPEAKILNYWLNEMAKHDKTAGQADGVRIASGVAQILAGMPVSGIMTLAGSKASPITHAIANSGNNFGTQEATDRFNKATNASTSANAIYNKKLNDYDLGKGNAGKATDKKLAGVDQPKQGTHEYALMNLGASAGEQLMRLLYELKLAVSTRDIDSNAPAIAQTVTNLENNMTMLGNEPDDNSVLIWKYYLFISVLNLNDTYNILTNDQKHYAENFIRSNQVAVSTANARSGTASGFTNSMSGAFDQYLGGYFEAPARR